MRFNPKADISGGRVRDRGGSGGGGAPVRIPLPGGARAGGGIGGILIVILFVVLVQCSGAGLSGPDGGSVLGGGQGGAQPAGIDTGDQRYANCDTGADANSDPDCARLGVAVSLEDYWSSELPDQAGVAFEPSIINTFAGATQTGCGEASSAVGPFYCPADQQIYLDTTFFADVLEQQLGGQGGDFVEPYVLAHEYGHHIQDLMGTMGQVRTQQGAESDAVRLELQADCYAGMWTQYAEDSQLLTLDDGDIAEALDSAKAVGDDRIQQQAGQRVDPEGWTHGSAKQRMAWFTRGYEEGTLEACDTFSASSL